VRATFAQGVPACGALIKPHTVEPERGQSKPALLYSPKRVGRIPQRSSAFRNYQQMRKPMTKRRMSTCSFSVEIGPLDFLSRLSPVPFYL